MKKQFAIVMILCLLLAGCSKTPEVDAAGSPWDKDWTAVGSLIGVEPQKDWTLEQKEDILASEGMYYCIWVKGDAVSFTTENGETVTTHPAEIHLMLSETPSADHAREVSAQWDEITRERYPDAQYGEGSFGGQDFTLSTYSVENTLGASAAGLRDNCVIRVDVVTLGDEAPDAILADFLNLCHYAK